MSPPLALSLVCPPPIRGYTWAEQIIAALEHLVGERLDLEVWTDGKCRPARERQALLGPMLFEMRLPDDRLILTESEAQRFIVYISGLTISDAVRETGRDAVYQSLSLGALLPVDLDVQEALTWLSRLSSMGRAWAAGLGTYIHDLRLRGRYVVHDHEPEMIELTWLNAWSAEVASRIAFPSAEDEERLWLARRDPTSGCAICALTEERLDLSRPDHMEAYTWAARRFGVTNPHQS